MARTRSGVLDRRRFLEIGAAASLAAALPELPHAAPRAIDSGARPRGRASEPLSLAPQVVIYDERFEGARPFAAAVRARDVPLRSIRGDVTQLWYSQLHPLWRRSPVMIAGLTAYAAMFCLEQLAWDHRLRMLQCAAGDAKEAAADWPMHRAAILAAAAAGPLHLWIIAPPAQLPALDN